jgi:hypothetical protein
MRFSKYFSQVLKVALEIMLSQKIAPLFALMAFASQGVIGRPSPQVGGSGGLAQLDTLDNAVVGAINGAVNGAFGAVQAAGGSAGGVRDAVGDVVSTQP